jgi:hypothetical protein
MSTPQCLHIGLTYDEARRANRAQHHAPRRAELPYAQRNIGDYR